MDWIIHSERAVERAETGRVETDTCKALSIHGVTVLVKKKPK
jgi:hypothetical protein